MNSTQSSQISPKFRIHWHVILIHLPISFYLVAFMFSFLSLFASRSCFETVSFILLSAGGLAMIPVTLTGWFTWKSNYHGLRGKLFMRKIVTAFVMLGLSIVLIVAESLNSDFWEHETDMIWTGIYFIGYTVLAVGAGIEGFYGGRLNHK